MEDYVEIYIKRNGKEATLRIPYVEMEAPYSKSIYTYFVYLVNTTEN